MAENRNQEQNFCSAWLTVHQASLPAHTEQSLEAAAVDDIWQLQEDANHGEEFHDEGEVHDEKEVHDKEGVHDKEEVHGEEEFRKQEGV